MTLAHQQPSIGSRPFIVALLLNLVWINVSEVLRYFLFVMPMMREALPTLENVAPMSWTIFAIWGLWDTILVFCVTGFVWIYLERFGTDKAQVLAAGSFAWLGIFCILWIGIYNMNLTSLSVVGVALALSWVELVIAAMIVNWQFRKPSS
ncbi:MAG: hypothetical protein AB8B81_03490 [Halioglobus sp.]